MGKSDQMRQKVQMGQWPNWLIKSKPSNEIEWWKHLFSRWDTYYSLFHFNLYLIFLYWCIIILWMNKIKWTCRIAFASYKVDPFLTRINVHLYSVLLLYQPYFWLDYGPETDLSHKCQYGQSASVMDFMPFSLTQFHY